MKRVIPYLFWVGLCLSVTLQSCKTETEPRPLADINTLAGKWGDSSYEITFDAATRQATITKASTNVYGFKTGQVKFKNVEAVDATTFRGESLYRSAAGYYLYADIKITVSGDVMSYTSDVGTLGSISVTGQTGQYQRIK